ncbi:MAG: radical SAM protein [Candidatus Omnitrophica bacterium]|nr:radical SAM protein [Candidatus Omnitrophota bacterium]
MEALLIQPPCWVVRTPPYNLALLKAVCTSAGHDVSCIDYNIKFFGYLSKNGEQYIYDNPTDWYNEAYVAELISKYSKFIDQCVHEIILSQIKVIGFSITGLSRFFAQEMARRIKLRDKERIIIFGGPHCFKDELGEKILYNCPHVDVICYLEGESALPNLLNILEKNQRLEPLPGMATRNQDGKIISSADVQMCTDLNSLPFADFSDFDLFDYTAEELPIATSRGCINRCLFCSESRVWGRYRFRNAESVFAEIKQQLSYYPFIKSFFFNDSLLNGSLVTLGKLSDLLTENKIKIQWGGQAAIRQGMSKELIEKMRKAGFSHVSYGLESASPRILRMIGKNFTVALAERVIRDTKKADIRTDVNVIVGFPTETREDILETVNFLRRNRNFIDQIFLHPLVLSHGSGFFEQKERWGIEYENFHNPNTWYSTKEDNSLSTRLERLKFYEAFIENKGKTFFTLDNYDLFIADDYFNRGEFKKAYSHYAKAQETNKDLLKNNFIKKRMELAKAQQ